MFTGYPWDITHPRDDLWISVGHRVLLGFGEMTPCPKSQRQILFEKSLALCRVGQKTSWPNVDHLFSPNLIIRRSMIIADFENIVS